jgi:hypothetical protein
MYAKQENAFITIELFTRWASELLFSCFDETSAHLQDDGHGVVPLDGYSAHIAEGVEEKCVWRGIEYVILPPHASDQV